MRHAPHIINIVDDLSALLPDSNRLPQFEQRVLEIADVLFTTGVNAMSGDTTPADIFGDEAVRRRFIAACHDGYAAGQRKLVDELLRVQSERKEAKATLKEARRKRDKAGKARAAILLSVLQFEEKTLRSLADALAWMLCGGRRWIVKRFHTGQTAPELESSNIESAIEVAEQFHKDDPLVFALVADLTSIINVGDLLVATLDGKGGCRLGLIELKEGLMNEAVSDFVDFFLRTGCPRAAYFFKQEYGDHAAEQADRMMRQTGRMAAISEVISTDRGTDLLTGQRIVLSKDEFVHEDYDEDLVELFTQAAAHGSRSMVIEGCLVIGAYDAREIWDPQLAFHHDVFHHYHPEEECPDPEAVDEATFRAALKPPYPVYDMLPPLYNMPLAKPVFMRPFSRDVKMDLLFGRMKLFACFDGEEFMHIANEAGNNVRWSTKKQANRKRSENSGLFEVNGRYMIASSGELEAFFGQGLFSQIVYDGMLPSSVIALIPEMFSLPHPAEPDEEASQEHPAPDQP